MGLNQERFAERGQGWVLRDRGKERHGVCQTNFMQEQLSQGAVAAIFLVQGGQGQGGQQQMMQQGRNYQHLAMGAVAGGGLWLYI